MRGRKNERNWKQKDHPLQFYRDGRFAWPETVRKTGGGGSYMRGVCAGKYAQEGVRPMPADRAELIGGQWGRAAFLFIGAAGIAVRFIARG